MTALAVILFAFCFACVGGIAVTDPRSRKYLFVKESPKQLPGESQSMRDWKQIFRETVVSVDGDLTPEMEAFLAGEEERVSKVLADARVAAEAERARILAEAAKARAEMFKEKDEWTTNDRPLLIGAAFEEYQVDYGSAQTAGERFNVTERWHNKGFRFPRAFRAKALSTATNRDTRDAYRIMFDEQDKPIKKEKAGNK